ncbi:hypothetical protein L3X07_07665 [Levilactobacillus brevis]|nr:hypothetical protein [Levilactobacillus brevis]
MQTQKGPEIFRSPSTQSTIQNGQTHDHPSAELTAESAELDSLAAEEANLASVDA